MKKLLRKHFSHGCFMFPRLTIIIFAQLFPLYVFNFQHKIKFLSNHPLLSQVSIVNFLIEKCHEGFLAML